MVEDIRGLEEEDREASGWAFVPLADIPGTDGDDVLEGTPEADVVSGMRGDDEITGGDGNDLLRGGGGTDSVAGQGGNDEVIGGGGNDTVSGGPGDDLVRGRGGNDTMAGGDGADEMRGAGGNDQMTGAQDNDEMYGGNGADNMAGGVNDDTMDGGLGTDRVIGGPGADDLNGGKGNDTVEGRRGDDIVSGGNGDDTLRGNQGDDILDGRLGFDVATGGDGLDTFRFSTLGQMQITDFDPAVEILDFSEILNFTPGDGIRNFVRFETNDLGTNVSVSPDGDGEFQLIAGLVDVNLSSLPRAQLGFPDGGGGGGGGGGTITEQTVVSTNLAGDVGNGISFLPSLSTNGGLITFSSSSINLIGTDDNGGTFDIFQKNIDTGEVTRVSERNVPGAGIQGGDDDSFGNSIAGDGSIVAFDSLANNFGGTDSAPRDVYVKDGDAVELVSLEGNTFAASPSLSADGSLVAFQATATGRAGTGDPAGLATIESRIFVRDLGTGDLTEVSSASSDVESFANGFSSDPDMAANGNFVAFESDATNLINNDAGDFRDVFVKNLSTGELQLASADASGDQGFGNSNNATISGTGRYVAFQSTAQFVEEDFNGSPDIYRKDLEDGSIQLVSINGDGLLANGPSYTPSISDDGRFVAFRSEASNLVAGDDNGQADIFVADLQAPGDFLRFEIGSDTSGALRDLVQPELSGDGSLVAFATDVATSDAGALTSGQVSVAPVDFDSAPAALRVADVLSDDGPRGSGTAPAAVDSGSTASLDSLLTPAEVV